MIPINFNESWHEYVYDLFYKDQKIQILKNYIKSNKDNLVPNVINLFRPFNINIHNVKGIIINNNPEYNSNGLLFGTNDLTNKSLINTQLNLKHNIYKNINNWQLDHTLEHWSKQDLLLLNIHLTYPFKDLEPINDYFEYFNLQILKILFNLNTNLPILCFGDVKHILLKYKIPNIIYGSYPDNSNFEFDHCFINYNNMFKRLYNFNFNF